MSIPGSVRSFLRRPRNAALFFVLAVGVWAFIFWQSSRSPAAKRHIEAGAGLLAKGQGAAAEREWQQAVRLDPRDAEAWELLGDYYIALNNWPAALDALRHVQKLRPETPELHPRLALAALQARDWKTAEQHSALALQRNPQDVTALKVTAALAEKNKRPDDQLKYLRQLVALRPQDPSSMMALAAVLRAQYQYGESLSLVERVLQLDPDFPDARALHGQLLYEDNPTPERLARAEADFKKILQSEPDNVEAHRYLARVYLRLNRPALAIHHFEEVGRDRPYASAHLFELSTAYRKAGQVRKADELLRRFSTLEQLSYRISELTSRGAKKPNDFDNYLPMAQLLLKSIESSDATYQLYRYKYLRRELASVEAYLNKAAQLRPNDAKLQPLRQRLEGVYQRHIQQGLQAVKRHNFERADWHLGRAVLLRPNDKRTHQALMRLTSLHQDKGTAAPRAVPDGSGSTAALGKLSAAISTPQPSGSP